MMFVNFLLCLLACQGILGLKESCEAENKAQSSDGASCYVCGRSNIPNNPVQSKLEYKKPTSAGDFPWHANIYRKMDEGWELFCGGTLVTQQVVITAAYCVASYSKKQDYSIVTLQDTQNLTVVLGKTNRMWNVTEPSELRQQVSKIVVHPLHKGPATNYAKNIGLIILNSKVTLTPAVMPACLDYNHNHNPHHKDDIGYIVGFGDTIDCFNPSCSPKPDSLQYSSASIRSFSECFAKFHTEYYKKIFHLNSDSFCIGNGTVSPITFGNGGDGITVIRQGLHYLAGVADFKLSPIDNYFTQILKPIYSIGAANNVTLNMDWIKANLPVDDKSK